MNRSQIDTIMGGVCRGGWPGSWSKKKERPAFNDQKKDFYMYREDFIAIGMKEI